MKPPLPLQDSQQFRDAPQPPAASERRNRWTAIAVGVIIANLGAGIGITTAMAEASGPSLIVAMGLFGNLLGWLLGMRVLNHWQRTGRANVTALKSGWWLSIPAAIALTGCQVAAAMILIG